MKDSMNPLLSPETILRRLAEDRATQTTQFSDLKLIATMHMQKIAAGHGERLRQTWAELEPLLGRVQQSGHKGELGAGAPRLRPRRRGARGADARRPARARQQ